MDLANLEGLKALKRGDYPAGCIIVKGDQIISKASSEGVTKNDVTAHAELKAISRACRKLKTRFLNDCTVYTNIEPCLMCAKAMVYSRIKRVVYGTHHKEYGNKKTFEILRRNDIALDIEVISGFDKNKPSKMLERFFEAKINI